MGKDASKFWNLNKDDRQDRGKFKFDKGFRPSRFSQPRKPFDLFRTAAGRAAQEDAYQQKLQHQREEYVKTQAEKQYEKEKLKIGEEAKGRIEKDLAEYRLNRVEFDEKQNLYKNDEFRKRYREAEKYHDRFAGGMWNLRCKIVKVHVLTLELNSEIKRNLEEIKNKYMQREKLDKKQEQDVERRAQLGREIAGLRFKVTWLEYKKFRLENLRDLLEYREVWRRKWKDAAQQVLSQMDEHLQTAQDPKWLSDTKSDYTREISQYMDDYYQQVLRADNLAVLDSLAIGQEDLEAVSRDTGKSKEKGRLDKKSVRENILPTFEVANNMLRQARRNYRDLKELQERSVEQEAERGRLESEHDDFATQFASDEAAKRLGELAFSKAREEMAEIFLTLQERKKGVNKVKKNIEIDWRKLNAVMEKASENGKNAGTEAEASNAAAVPDTDKHYGQAWPKLWKAWNDRRQSVKQEKDAPTVTEPLDSNRTAGMPDSKKEYRQRSKEWIKGTGVKAWKVLCGKRDDDQTGQAQNDAGNGAGQAQDDVAAPQSSPEAGVSVSQFFKWIKGGSNAGEDAAGETAETSNQASPRQRKQLFRLERNGKKGKELDDSGEVNEQDSSAADTKEERSTSNSRLRSLASMVKSSLGTEGFTGLRWPGTRSDSKENHKEEEDNGGENLSADEIERRIQFAIRKAANVLIEVGFGRAAAEQATKAREELHNAYKEYREDIDERTLDNMIEAKKKEILANRRLQKVRTKTRGTEGNSAQRADDSPDKGEIQRNIGKATIKAARALMEYEDAKRNKSGDEDAKLDLAEKSAKYLRGVLEKHGKNVNDQELFGLIKAEADDMRKKGAFEPMEAVAEESEDEGDSGDQEEEEK